MKCPNCGYFHGWNADSQESVEGKNGDYYTHPVEMERSCLDYYRDKERHILFGCPNCGVAFMCMGYERE